MYGDVKISWSIMLEVRMENITWTPGRNPPSDEARCSLRIPGWSSKSGLYTMFTRATLTPNSHWAMRVA